MMEAAEALEFERAAMLRDQLYELKVAHGLVKTEAQKTGKPVRYAVSKKRGPSTGPGSSGKSRRGS